MQTATERVEKHLDAESISELVGRMYECCELGGEIERRRFRSIASVLRHLKREAGRMSRTIEAAQRGETVTFDGPFLVLKD